MANIRVLQPPRNLSPDLRLQSQIVDLSARLSVLERSVADRATGALWARTASGTVPSGGATVRMTSVPLDANGWFDLATGHYTPQVPGLYLLMSYFSISTGVTTNTRLFAGIYRDSSGSVLAETGQVCWAVAGNDNAVAYATTMEADGVNTWFMPYLNHNFTSNLTVRTNCYLRAHLVGSL